VVLQPGKLPNQLVRAHRHDAVVLRACVGVTDFVKTQHDVRGFACPRSRREKRPENRGKHEK